MIARARAARAPPSAAVSAESPSCTDRSSLKLTRRFRLTRVPFFFRRRDFDFRRDDFSFFPLMCVGGAGVISVVSNVDPLSTVALAEAARDGDLASGAQLHHFMQPLIRWLFSDTNPVPTKAALAQMGLCGATARLPSRRRP